MSVALHQCDFYTFNEYELPNRAVIWPKKCPWNYKPPSSPLHVGRIHALSTGLTGDQLGVRLGGRGGLPYRLPGQSLAWHLAASEVRNEHA